MALAEPIPGSSGYIPSNQVELSFIVYVSMCAADVELPTNDAVTAVFRENWRIYRRMIELNFLHHEEIIKVFSKHLGNTENATTRLRILDVGCGDAWLPLHLLSLSDAPCEIEQFVGVDLTAEALQLARSTAALQLPSVPMNFVRADMTDFLTSCPDGAYTIVMSSYAIHHLTQQEKATLLSQIHRCLAPNGVFLWADVYNAVEGSSREEVMRRWRPRYLGFDGLTAMDRATIWEHVSHYDFPEDLPTMETSLRTAGFEALERAFDDGFQTIVWVSRKT